MAKVCQTFGRTYQETPETIKGRRVYLVDSNTDIDNLDFVLTAPGIPDMNDPWDSLLTYLVVTSRTPIEIGKEKRHFKVQIDYDTDATQLGWRCVVRTMRQPWVPVATEARYDEAPNDPYSAGRYLAPGDQDSLTGYAFLNRAGDPFEAPPKINRYGHRIECIRTVNSIADIGNSLITNINDLRQYLGNMNSNPLLSIAGLDGLAWEFLIDDMTFEPIVKATGEILTRVTIIILFHPSWGHALPVLNAGFREKVDKQGGGKTVQDCRNQNGTGSRKPSLLDADGVAIKDRPATAPEQNLNGPPFYVVFPCYQSADFAALDLPATWE